MRPLMQLPFEELDKMFKKSQSNLAVLVSLQGELVHRKRPFAKQLLEAVNAQLAVVQSKSASAPAKVTGGTPPGGKSAVEPKEGLKAPVCSKPIEGKAAPELHPSAETAHERLRATFTEEGEFMARWGMTPTLPPQLRKLLVDGWRSLLMNSSTADGRTLADLEADLKRIEALRGGGK